MALEHLRRELDKRAARRAEDARRFESLDSDLCVLCHAYGEDKRSLHLDCFYDIHEVVPEALDLAGVEDERALRRGFFLRICKSCRGALLERLRDWREERVSLRGAEKDSDGRVVEDDPRRNIPVRIHGAVQMLTEEEFYDRMAERTSTQRSHA